MFRPSVCIITVLVTLCHSANILVITPFTSTSHYMMLRPIGLELARIGHNVTVITAHAEKKHPPSYHQVMADDKKIWEAMGNGGRPNVFTTIDFWFSEFYTEVLWKGGLFTTETALNSTPVKEFMSQDNKFDLVICELFYQEALTMFAHKYQAPLVFVTTYGNSMRSNFLLRNPLQQATLYHEFGYFEEPYSFSSRLKNFLFLLYEMFWFYTWYLPQQEAFVPKYFKDLPQPVPKLVDIHKNVSLVLLNSHPSIDEPVAYPPNHKEIGGIHLYTDQFTEKLPKDLQDFLENATDGVVYMNFGSNVKSSELPPERRDAFLKVFGQLKQKVLWKWEDGDLAGKKPDNVEIRPWMPQKQILSHPNVHLFISHGGLIGTQEATFRGVPILGVPIYCDQYNNVLQTQNNGNGLLLQYKDITEKTLREKVVEILSNKSYAENAKKMAIRFKDRDISPLDSAVFWIEYVIRNNGAGFLKNRGIELSWISWSMIDVYLTVVGFVVLILFVCFKLVVIVMSGSKKSKKDKTKKNK